MIRFASAGATGTPMEPIPFTSKPGKTAETCPADSNRAASPSKAKKLLQRLLCLNHDLLPCCPNPCDAYSSWHLINSIGSEFNGVANCQVENEVGIGGRLKRIALGEHKS